MEEAGSASIVREERVPAMVSRLTLALTPGGGWGGGFAICDFKFEISNPDPHTSPPPAYRGRGQCGGRRWRRKTSCGCLIRVRGPRRPSHSSSCKDSYGLSLGWVLGWRV